MGWGSKFQKSGKFHELSRKSIKHLFTPPPTKGGRSGNFRGSKNQKSGKCHELPRKVITKNLPHPTPPGVGSFMGKNFKCQTFHQLSRIYIFWLAPPPPIRRGGVRGENFKVTASSFKKYLGNAVILCGYYTAHILGEAGKGMIVFFRFLYCK